MDLEWDEAKRIATLQRRGLDFVDAGRVFSEVTVTVEDDRQDYGEPRYQTIGQLGEDIVMLVWTPRGPDRRIISMRKCDARERARYLAVVAGG